MNQPDFNKITALYREREEKFLKYAELLRTYNEKYNLTSIMNEKDVLYKHFLDSLAGIDEFYANANVAEIGSGGGFPSIPLKIVREDLNFTLVESTGKKCEFLRTCIRELDLNRVTVVNSRAEELGKTPAFREKFDVCCARAVARMSSLVEYCLPFVRKNGIFLAYKGEAEEELKEAQRAIAVLGGGKAESTVYLLPENYGKRTLVKVEKIGCTPEKDPRGNGKERSKPIL